MVPMKRSLEDDHAPSIPSPLNPEAASKARVGKGSSREQREKKDSLKKRESVGIPRAAAPDHVNKKRKNSLSNLPGLPSPIRYNHALPREPFHYVVKDPAYASHEPDPFYTPDGTELRRPIDQLVTARSLMHPPLTFLAPKTGRSIVTAIASRILCSSTPDTTAILTANRTVPG